MRKSVMIDVGKDFSMYPAGRFVDDGPASGAAFRDKVLVPYLKSEQSVEVFLDNAEGYGSSFLEEAFGGLVRVGEWSASELRTRITISSMDESMIEEIWDYIEAADKARH